MPFRWPNWNLLAVKQLAVKPLTLGSLATMVIGGCTFQADEDLQAPITDHQDTASDHQDTASDHQNTASDHQNTESQGVPQVIELTELREALLAPEGRAGLRLEVVVSGGAPGERYVLEIKADSDGAATYRYLDQLKAVEEVRGSASVSAEHWDGLLRALASSSLVRREDQPVTVVPDSTVLRWMASAGDETGELLLALEAEAMTSDNQAVMDATYRVATELIGPSFAPPENG